MAVYVIVGGVAGGMSAAARLRRLDEKAEIVVFEKGEYVSYANCGLPYYIGGEIRDRGRLLVQTVRSFSRRFNVDVRVGHEITDIDRQNKMVIAKNLTNGAVIKQQYEKLVLSPGASPFKPDIPGINHPLVFTLRSIPDTDQIKGFIDQNKPERALIIGGGFIGLEMAENLSNRGIQVTIVEAASQVMSALDSEMAALVHQHLKSKGVSFYLSDSVVAFDEKSGKLNARLKSGLQLTADMVILSIGVKPDLDLAVKAGLETGPRKGIKVNEYMQTSDPYIYAVGDAVETLNPIIGKYLVVPLAGPANKEGRIAADNIVTGNTVRYEGSIGTAIAKVFDLTVGVTGLSEKVLKAEGIPYHAIIIHPGSHAGYYPNSQQLSLKLLFSPKDGKVLGAQSVGFDGVDKRIDVIALAVQNKLTVKALEEFEHAYAPPYSSAKDPVNMAGFVAGNVLQGKSKVITWDAISGLDQVNTFLLDVRTPDEYRAGAVSGAVNIPVDSLREQLGDIPRDKTIVLYCKVGLRGYIAERILEQNGFTQVYNLTGGFYTYSAAIEKQDNPAI